MNQIKSLLNQIHPDFNYDNSDDFITDGLLDSIDLQELFALIEKHFNIELAGTDLAPQNFKNLESIAELLAAHNVNLED